MVPAELAAASKDEVLALGGGSARGVARGMGSNVQGQIKGVKGMESFFGPRGKGHGGQGQGGSGGETALGDGGGRGETAVETALGNGISSDDVLRERVQQIVDMGIADADAARHVLHPRNSPLAPRPPSRPPHPEYM